MDHFTEHDVQQWAYILELMQANAVHGGDAYVVGEAATNISSGAGLV
jgi:hypothetical protein